MIHTLINSGQTFKYTVKFPANEPTGLYWYHPHVHPLTEAAVQGGASGAIIVDGIENYQPAVAGLPARVLLVRDQTIPNGPSPGGKGPVIKELQIDKRAVDDEFGARRGSQIETGIGFNENGMFRRSETSGQ